MRKKYLILMRIIVPLDKYLNFFAWDEAKHPHRRPLSEIVTIIQSVKEKYT